jgi:outer membrane protein, multidrug efflux system
MKKNDHFILPVLVATLGLTACAALPPGKALVLDAGAKYALDGAPQVIAPAWWHVYGFAPIQAWRSAALKRAPGVALARANIAQAQALVEIEGSQTGWDSALNSSVTGQRYSEFSIVPPQLAGSTRAAGRVGLDVNKRFDLFDLQANKVLGAEAKVAAARLGMQLVELELTRAICAEAINLAEAENARVWADLRVEKTTEGLNIESLRVRAGLAPTDALIRPRLEIARSQEWRARALGAAALARARLRILTGLTDQQLVLLVKPDGGLAPLNSAADATASLPVDLLAHRVDVQIALLRVQSASFIQTAAEAGFYPNVDLNLFASLSAIGLPRLLDLDAAAFGATPALHLPIFQRAQLHARLHVAQSDVALAAADYATVVQQAANEVASGIAMRDGIRAQLSAIEAMAAQATLALKAAELLAERGLTNRLPVITAMGPVLDAKMQLLTLSAMRWRSDLALTTALGGGYVGPGLTQTNFSQNRGAP